MHAMDTELAEPGSCFSDEIQGVECVCIYYRVYWSSLYTGTNKERTEGWGSLRAGGSPENRGQPATADAFAPPHTPLSFLSFPGQMKCLGFQDNIETQVQTWRQPCKLHMYYWSKRYRWSFTTDRIQKRYSALTVRREYQNAPCQLPISTLNSKKYSHIPATSFARGVHNFLPSRHGVWCKFPKPWIQAGHGMILLDRLLWMGIDVKLMTQKPFCTVSLLNVSPPCE